LSIIPRTEKTVNLKLVFNSVVAGPLYKIEAADLLGRLNSSNCLGNAGLLLGFLVSVKGYHLPPYAKLFLLQTVCTRYTAHVYAKLLSVENQSTKKGRCRVRLPVPGL